MLSPRLRRATRWMIAVFVFSGVLGPVLSGCETIPVTRGFLDELRDGFALPPYASINRLLSIGTHPYVAILPRAAECPAMQRIVPGTAEQRAAFLKDAKVRIALTPDYAHIDDKDGVIVVSWWYYHLGTNVDLYLDLLHELTHIRQLHEGKDLWDSSRPYVDRPTEIEGYAVAVEEARRLGLADARIREHLHNPWMNAEEVERLTRSIDALLAGKPAEAPVTESR